MEIYVCTFKGPVEIVGPFKTQEEAAAWGRGWQHANSDDPRWNTVDLDPNDKVRFITPE